MDINFNYNVRLHVPTAPKFIQRWQSWSAEAAGQHPPTQAGIAYGHGATDTLDFYACGKPNAPLLVFIHGGYWKTRDRTEFSWVAPEFLKSGVSVAIVDYGLAPAYKIDQMMDQVVRAHTWLHKNAERLDIDNKRFITSGHSAGGHLAAHIATVQGQLYGDNLPTALTRAVFATSGLFDLRPLVALPFLKELQLDDESAVRLSPAFCKPHADVPVFLSYGTAETEAFIGQTQILAAAWRDQVREVLPLNDCNHYEAGDSYRSGSLVDAILKQFRSL